jgi:hypothetical protein
MIALVNGGEASLAQVTGNNPGTNFLFLYFTLAGK